ncbi:MAG: hypothetical protein D6813_11215 [Calditrichaeota bacterium]|nr:MAG: hypothetical protein D6813_11215 [Calditrichota bacterium]
MGKAFIWLAFLTTLFSAWNYLSSTQKLSRQQRKREKKHGLLENRLRTARQSFYLATGLILLTMLYFGYLILTHQFQYEYVYRYSSRELSFGLLLSTIWAGQAGSFLLWTLLITVMAIIFRRSLKSHEGVTMGFLNLTLAFFLLLLIKVNPFKQLSQIPPDGAGLNPLLQNFWMIIHPPLLFLGYAAATFPFVLALSALARNDYKIWLNQALPWALVTSITLGAGIIVGAYWAYGVLGWGGYWGWDPVENSSLIPWLLNMALVHGLIVEKIKGSLKKTNLFLALITFVLILYATFLTRSGVLADFSVHSFQDLGLYGYLLFFIFSAMLSGLYLFVKRMKKTYGEPVNLHGLTRENLILLSLLVFVGTALVIFIGTSFPILTGLLGQPREVNLTYYNIVGLPFAILMALLLGIAPLLKWFKSKSGDFLKQLVLALVLASLSTIMAFKFGVQKRGVLLVFIFTIALGFWSNTLVLIQQIRHHWIHLGAPLAHLGVVIMFAGVIISGNFSQKQTVPLNLERPQNIFGYQLKFMGIEHHDKKQILKIKVTNGGQEFVATPKLYYSEYNQSMIREPYIEAGIFNDIYFSPIDIPRKRKSIPESLTLKKGEKRKVGDFEVRFVDYDMSLHSTNGSIKIGAKLEIMRGSDKVMVTPALLVDQNHRKTEPAIIPFTPLKGKVFLQAINADQKSIVLAFNGLEDSDGFINSEQQIIVQVSKKPFISFVWMGTFLLTLGTVIALKKRLS